MGRYRAALGEVLGHDLGGRLGVWQVAAVDVGDRHADQNEGLQRLLRIANDAAAQTAAAPTPIRQASRLARGMSFD